MTPLAEVLARHPAVAAITVVGSRASGTSNEGSDIDLFVYADADIMDVRVAAAEDLADPGSPVIIDQDPYGSADVWRTHDGTWIDLMVWTPAWAEEQLARVIDRCEPSLGYTTAFWRSIARGTPLYERDSWHPQLQERSRAPYPDRLVDAIVAHNLPRLGAHPFSFLHQLEGAVARGDAISVNHRTAAWLGSYFDVLFALNKVLHPGEKRIMPFVRAECRRVPPSLEEHVVAATSTSDPVPTLREMLVELETLIGR